MQVKIYCLYDPYTLKIRYIGRTKCSLEKRLREHISKSKNYLKNTSNEQGSYKINWINSLLKIGLKPKIRLLTLVEGWEESHILEKELINKHLVKHNLVNGDDRGPGKLSKNISKKSEKERIEKIKDFFSKEENKKNFYNPMYAYNLDGSLYKKFESVKFAGEELGISPQKISASLNSFDNKNMKTVNRNGFYFSKKLYDKHPLANKITYQSNRRIVIVKNINNGEEKTFLSFLEFGRYYNLGHWDLHQLQKNIFTQKVKDLQKTLHINMPS
jgi:hypothetical protein